MLLQVLAQQSDVECSLDPEGPRERPSPLGVAQTFEIEMQPSTPTRKSLADVRNHRTVDRDHTQQLRRQRPGAASNARANRADVLGNRT